VVTRLTPNNNRELDSDFYLHNTHVQNGPLQSMREYKKDLYYPDVEEQEQLLEVDDDTSATSLHTSSHAAAASSAAAANHAWQDNTSSRVRQVYHAQCAVSCSCSWPCTPVHRCCDSMLSS
jgi:hypothetical protein